MNQPINLEEIIESVKGLNNEALHRLSTHVNGLLRQSRGNVDDPSEAPES